MNLVNLQNPYLKENAFTTTKNKYISNVEQTTHLQSQLHFKSQKRKIEKAKIQRSLPFIHKSIKCKELFRHCGTENLILKKDSTAIPKCLKKKKKRSGKIYSPNVCDFQSLRVGHAPDNESRDMDCMDYCMDFEEEACFEAAPSGSTLSSTQDVLQIFGSNNRMSTSYQGKALFDQPTASLFSAPGATDSSLPITGFGFGGSSSGTLFGSAPPAAPLAAPHAAFRSVSRKYKPQMQMQTAPMFFTPAPQPLHRIAPDIMEMPSYQFGSGWQSSIKKQKLFEPIDFQDDLYQFEKVNKVKHTKMQLLSCASQALFTPTNFKDQSDEYRLSLNSYADDVSNVDPEFILKVALYCRQELNLRTVSNYLLSYSAFNEFTRPFLEKYFEACINLPTDWIDVAELYQTFDDQRLKTGSLPSALKHVMKKTFIKFDTYQLAKYNRKKNKKEKKKMEIDSSDDAHISRSFTLKQLIRLIHIDKPSYEIMCILGKKYPETPELFKECKLPDSWDPKLVGTRMKLPLPITWETQISSHGNKADVWERLLDNHNLPYMALLRNLRNIILAGISTKHHDKALKYLENKNAVLNSRQLPLQFYEAYKVLVSIEELLNLKDASSDTETKQSFFAEELRPKRQKISPNLQLKLEVVSRGLLQRYKMAVSKALDISFLQNLPPIPGKTLIICMPSQLECSSLRISAKTKNKAVRLCIMIGLMCLKASEDGEAILINGIKSERVAVNENKSFLQSFVELCAKSEELYKDHNDVEDCVGTLKNTLDHHLKQQVLLKEKLDHVILLKGEIFLDAKNSVSTFLRKYRELINSDLLFTDIYFGTAAQSYATADEGKDVYLSGNNPQIMKFIAERSTGGQLNVVENIDLKYDLSSTVVDKILNHPVTKDEDDSLQKTNLPKWHTVKVFLSSTFKDMHSERDVLIRYVMPELRKRAASVYVKINEIDLRWGITEVDCASKRAAEICLLEAQRSDLFVGILGNRYGTLYNFDPQDLPELQWVKDYPNGLSITELEMHAGALRKANSDKRGFFYLRSEELYDCIPANHQKYFSAENDESSQKVEELRRKILSSSNKVYSGYPFNFAGVLKGKPVLGGLESFGQRVLEDLWQAVSEMHKKDPYANEFAEEEDSQMKFLNSLDYVHSKSLCGDSCRDFIKKIKAEDGVFLVSGPPGCGKTTFIVDVLRKFMHSEHPVPVVKFFVGLTPRSTDVSYILQYICKYIAKQYTVSSVFPKLMNDILNCFSDVLREAVTYAGGNFFLVIDGLDHLNKEDQFLDWLPLDLPKGLRIICTASNSSYVHDVLNRQLQQTAGHIHSVPLMSQSDRECLVKHYLQLYGKALDESPFNNQMLKLVTKKDSAIPLFLRLGCDFLRCYGEFETFTSMLQSLPTSIPMLIQEIIVQMENTYSTVLVQNALTLLSITKEGLDDADLHLLLSVVSSDKQKNTSFVFEDLISFIRHLGPDDKLSHVTYCALIHNINTFAYGNNRPRKLNLSGSEFQLVAQKYYLNKNYSTLSNNLHCLMAAYYKTLCDPENNKSWISQSPTAFRSLIYHLYNGNCYVELLNILCSIDFLEAVFSLKISDTVLEYYPLLLFEKKNMSNKTLKNMDFSLLSAYYEFVCRNIHILQKYPGLVSQQALNEPSSSLVKLSYSGSKSSKIECISEISNELRIITLGGFVKNITAAVCEDGKQLALLGSQDGHIKVLDFNFKRIIRSIRGHSSEITHICYAGKDKVCTASTDTTLSIWSTVDFHRIAVLKGHRHNVSCCCADLTSNILLSSGWDNSVRLWSLTDGRSISVIEDFRCPVNCVAQNPVKTQIAVGLWSGLIELWDTIELKKTEVFESSCRSVKSLIYTPDGINVISSYMNSDILIWSSERGLKMSSLKGHILPVNSISYSMTNEMIISGGSDCSLKVWSMNTGLDVQNLSSCKMCPMELLQFISPNLIGIGFQNGEVWVQDITNDSNVCKWHPESDMVTCISRSSGENLSYTSIIIGTQSGKIMEGNTITNELKSVGSMCTRVTSLFHIEKLILAANIEGDIGVFYAFNGQSKTIPGAHHGLISAVNLFSHGGMSWALSAGSDKAVKLWQINEKDVDLKFQKEYISKHKDLITYCCWFQKSQVYEKYFKFLSGSQDNNVILQDENSILHFYGLKTSVKFIDYTDNCIIGCGVDGSLAVWSLDAALLTYVSSIDQSSAVLTFDVPKGLENEVDVTLAFADIDGSLKIRKPIQKSCVYSLDGHSKAITSCCTNASGDLLSSSLDGTISLWKIPFDQKTTTNRSSLIRTVLMFSDLAVSSDTEGNVCVWKIDETAVDSSLQYAANKNYPCGFINAMCKAEEEAFVCGVTQFVNGKETYFVDYLNLTKKSLIETDSSIVSIKGMNKFCLQNEVTCLSANSESKTFVAGLKSGELAIFTPKLNQVIKVSDEWILHVSVLCIDTSEYIFANLLNSDTHRYHTSKLLETADASNTPFRKLLSSSSDAPFITAFSSVEERSVFCGDTKGRLLFISVNPSENVIKEAHNSTVTGISISEELVFTCSLDRTVKGWNIATLEQVCQFHLSVSITSIVAKKVQSEMSYVLLIGTSSGDVHFLKFHP